MGCRGRAYYIIISDIGIIALQQSGASSSLRILSSQFNGAGNSRALDLTDVQFVLMNNTTFSTYNTPSNKIQLQNIANRQGLQAFDAAVRIENVQFCVSRSSTFNNNDIAILDATDGFGTLRPSNIFLIDQTTFTDNKVVVFMRGNNTGGLVMADCAVFANNHWGIAGSDSEYLYQTVKWD